MENFLSQQEKRDVKDILKDRFGEFPNEEQETKLSMRKMLHKRSKTDANEKYIRSDFILGSAAEVELVWSTAKHILSDVRSKPNPFTFEAINFLKYHEMFWNDQFVAETICRAKSERSQNRFDELQFQLAFDSEGEVWSAKRGVR